MSSLFLDLLAARLRNIFLQGNSNFLPTKSSSFTSVHWSLNKLYCNKLKNSSCVSGPSGSQPIKSCNNLDLPSYSAWFLVFTRQHCCTSHCKCTASGLLKALGEVSSTFAPDISAIIGDLSVPQAGYVDCMSVEDTMKGRHHLQSRVNASYMLWSTLSILNSGFFKRPKSNLWYHASSCKSFAGSPVQCNASALLLVGSLILTLELHKFLKKQLCYSCVKAVLKSWLPIRSWPWQGLHCSQRACQATAGSSRWRPRAGSRWLVANNVLCSLAQPSST